MKTLRTTLIAFAVAAAAIALTACAAPRAALTPVAEAPAKKTIVEMEFELRKLELETEQKSMMSLVKFADESKSDYAKGVVSGMLGAKFGGSSAGASARPSIMQAQAQQSQIDLQRAEFEARTGPWAKGMQVLGLVRDYSMFSKGLGFQKFQVESSNAQNRYMFDNMRGTQQDAYSFTRSAFGQGSSATLGGINAGATAAATGAGAVTGASASPTE